MSALSTAAEGVSAAERDLLVSRCTVRRPGALSGQLDPDTGLDEQAPATTVAAGVGCYVKAAAAAAQSDSGGDVVVVSRPQVWLSVSAPKLLIGDQITVDASPNAANVGRVFTVVGSGGSDLSVLARYDVEVIVQ